MRYRKGTTRDPRVSGHRRFDGGVALTHIEVEGCIVNIREGLTDRFGRRVTSVEVIPDLFDSRTGRFWKRLGMAHVRVVELKGGRRR